MGNLLGHVLPGLGFFLIGLWHLLNQVKLHILHPKSYISFPWFPTPRIKHLELFFIMCGTLVSISMELFIGPSNHSPFDRDGTIPSNHLRNLEHANISISLLLYALISLLLDVVSPPDKYALSQLIGAIAFGQELLLFHLHSTDHVGVEGQYHWLLQLVIFVSFVTALLGISFPSSFINSFVRSYSILLQGGWMIFMGFMLWTPGFIPMGCFINDENGHFIVRCHTPESLERAKSLANIEFCWFSIGVVILVVSIYLVSVNRYSKEVGYESLSMECQHHKQELVCDVEARKGFLELGKLNMKYDAKN